MSDQQQPQGAQPLADMRALVTEFACPDHPVPGPGGESVVPLSFGSGPTRIVLIVPAANAEAIGRAIMRAGIAAPAEAIHTAGNMQEALDTMRRGGG